MDNALCGRVVWSFPSTNSPVHVSRLWANPWLPGVNAGIVQDSRDVLVAVPHLEGKQQLSETFQEKRECIASHTRAIVDPNDYSYDDMGAPTECSRARDCTP